VTAYVDTSAAAKLLIDEPESRGVATYLDKLAADNVSLVSSILLETELRRLAMRHNLSQTLVSEILHRFDLIEPDRAIFVEAGLLPGTHLRTLDALHIATAVRVGANAIVGYDTRQLDGARELGISVVTP
jgi:predicted nucleic acid-binding protein